MKLERLRVGYVPYSTALDQPGDRRRFVHFARARGLQFEIADPNKPYDVVVLSERADLSVWRRYQGGKLVYDLIDSYLAVPRTSVKGQLRGLAKFASRQSRYLELDYWRSTQAMCARCDAVVCTTEEQKHHILPWCSNVHIVLDAHSMVSRTTKTNYQSNAHFRVVWEGMAQNLDSLLTLEPVLRRLSVRHKIAMDVITDPEYFQYLGRYGRRQSAQRVANLCESVTLHEWQEQTLAEKVVQADLAVIPLALDDAFAAGKPENKLLLLWRMGMPVVTSATPAYFRAMAGAGLSLSCRNAEEWENALDCLIGDAAARRHAGESGRRYAEQNHSEEQLLKQWDGVFASIL